MTKSNSAKKFVDEWKDILCLSEWVISLRLYQKLSSDNQSCHWRYSEKKATIRISLNQPTDEMEHSIAHELLHLVLSPCNRVFDNLNESKVAKKERAVNDSEYNLAQNVTIEQLLRTLYTAHGKVYPPHKG